MEYLHIIVVFLAVFSVTESACNNGWLRHGTTCYHFGNDLENWFGALGFCKLMGGTLLEINDADENTFITSQIALRGKNYHAYIALSDVVEENVWLWMVSNAQLTSSSYTNWGLNQPNNHGGQENCVIINPSGQWNDKACADVHQFICEQSDAGSIEVVG